MRKLVCQINSCGWFKLLIISVLSLLLAACIGSTDSSTKNQTSVYTPSTKVNLHQVSADKATSDYQHYAYVASSYMKTISMFGVNPTDGSLEPLNPPTITTIHGAQGLVTDPTGKYLYTMDSSDNTISTYQILWNGQLELLTVTPSIKPFPYRGVMSQGGDLYVTAGEGDEYVCMYSSNPNTGQLTYVNCQPTPLTSFGIALNPIYEDYIYVATSNYTSPELPGYISMFKKHENKLEGNGTVTGTLGYTNDLAFYPNGKYLYVVGSSGESKELYTYKVDLTSGKLTLVAKTNTDYGSNTIAVDQTGNFIYVGNEDQGNLTIATYRVKDNGETLIRENSIGVMQDMVDIKILNGYLYAVLVGNYVIAYHINPNSGALTLINYFDVPAYPSKIVFSKKTNIIPAIKQFGLDEINGIFDARQIKVTLPYGSKLESLVATFSTTTDTKMVSINGIPQTSGVTHNNFTYPVNYLITAKNGLEIQYTVTAIVAPKPNVHAYVTNFNDNTVSMYKQLESGSLVFESTVATGINPNEIVISPQHTFAYVANNTGSISGYSVDTNNGILTHRPNLDLELSGSPKSISFDPSGKHIYIVNQSHHEIHICDFNNNSGVLTNCKIHVVDGYGSRKIIFLQQDLYTYAYVINSDSSTISIYRELSDGSLTTFSEQPSITTGRLPIDIRSNGQYMYVVNASENTISLYQINGGKLSPLATKSVTTGLYPSGIAINRFGYAYVTNTGQGTISMYDINSDGGLSPKETTSGLKWPVGLILDASWATQYVYAINGSGNHSDKDDDTISMYKIDSLDGKLIPLSQPTVPTGKTPNNITSVNFSLGSSQ